MTITFNCKQVEHDLTPLRQRLYHLQKLAHIKSRQTHFFLCKDYFCYIDHRIEVEFLTLNIEGCVHHYPCDPCFQLCFLPEIFYSLEHFYEPFLDNVFSFGSCLRVTKAYYEHLTAI